MFFYFALTTSEHANNKNDSVQFRLTHTESAIEREREINLKGGGGERETETEHQLLLCVYFECFNFNAIVVVDSPRHDICGTIMRRAGEREREIEQKTRGKEKEKQPNEYTSWYIHNSTNIHTAIE